MSQVNSEESASMENVGVHFQQLRGKAKQSRKQRAWFKLQSQRKRSQQQYGCDRGGRPGGSIGSRRQEPPGWKQREGCQCALHYGGECRDFVKNSTDIPRRRNKLKRSVPVEHARCNRCYKIGHLARDCYESRFDAKRQRSRVECSEDEGRMMITVYKDPTAIGGFADEEKRLVVDEVAENWDDESNVGSPPPIEVEFAEEDFEIRSVAEISDESSDEESPQQSQNVVSRYDLPSPETIMRTRKEGEQRMRAELKRRSQERERQAQSPSRSQGDDHGVKFIGLRRVAEPRQDVQQSVSIGLQKKEEIAVEKGVAEHRVTRSRNVNVTKESQPKSGLFGDLRARMEATTAVVRCEQLPDHGEADRKN